jgi:hypothetical protein
MNQSSEDPLAMAARHVMEGEERVARQEAILEELVKDGREREAAAARKVLETMQTTLKLAREHLRWEQVRHQP